jgi:hypothetical protein
VFEETGLRVSVDALLAVDFWGDEQLDLLYRCTVVSGTFRASDEASAYGWAAPSALPELLPNQVLLLRKAGVL